MADSSWLWRKLLTVLCCFNSTSPWTWSWAEEKGVFRGTQKACEIIRALCWGVRHCLSRGKVLIVTAPGFTFFNLRVTPLSEDSTEATSPAEINKSWHTERWRRSRRQDEGPTQTQSHMRGNKHGCIDKNLSKLWSQECLITEQWIQIT